MIIAQITDLHVQAEGTDGPDSFDPAADTRRCLRALASLEPRPDLVLMTGDLVNRRSEPEYRRLATLLADFPLPCFLLAGNHDGREALRAVFGPLPYDQGGSFLHYVVEAGPVRIVALDTLQPGEIGGVLCTERLAWFEARLAEAPDAPTLVAMHHPPFVTGLAHLDRHGFEGMSAFREIVERHPQVRLIVAGHTHRAIWTRIGGAAVATCPSATYAFGLDLLPEAPGGRSDEPGGFMLHMWQPDEGRFVTHTKLLPARS